MIALKVSDASRSLSWEKRLWQGRLQEFSVDFCASVAVIYWGKEEKCSSGRKDLLFARIWIHKEGFRGGTDAGNRANRLAFAKSWVKRKITWRFKCTRTLNSVNMDMCLRVFMHGCICAHSYPKTLPQHFLRVDWHTNLMLMCASNHLCMPGHTNQSGFCIRHSSPRQVRLTHLTWCQLLPA